MTKLGTVLIFLAIILTSCNSGEFGRHKKDALKDTLSLSEEILNGKIEPINPSVFKHLIETKKRLPVPPPIPQATYIQDFAVRGGDKKDMCYQSTSLQTVVASCDYKTSSIRNAALRLAANNPGVYNLGQMCDIFDYSIANWKYVNDPIGYEYVAKASETLEQDFAGDCDDFATILGSMLMAVGGDIRINYAFNDTSGHAFVEANLGEIMLEDIESYLKNRYDLPSSVELQTRKDPSSRNTWLNMDWFAKHPGGKYFPYNRGYRFYVIDSRCESFTINSDLKKYNPTGTEIYDKLQWKPNN